MESVKIASIFCVMIVAVVLIICVSHDWDSQQARNTFKSCFEKGDKYERCYEVIK